MEICPLAFRRERPRDGHNLLVANLEMRVNWSIKSSYTADIVPDREANEAIENSRPIGLPFYLLHLKLSLNMSIRYVTRTASPIPI
jgi:hypothetical protein